MTGDTWEEPMPDSAVPSLVPSFGLLNGDFDRDRPVAVVGEPFSGRKKVLDHIADRLGATQFRLDPGATPEAVLEHIDDGPVVVGRCQHLYRREIGGFEGLETVLNALARTDETIVTGWNSTAWSYLDAVRDVGEDFETFELGALSGPELGEIVRSQVGTLPSFRIDRDEEPVVQFDGDATRWRDLSVPAIDWEAIRSRLGPSSEPEAVFFDRLASVAGGNPGVALAIWRSLPDDELKPSDIEVPSVELDRVAAFLLRVILTQETVARGSLTEYVGDRLDRLLASLCGDGIVSDDGDQVTLEATGVPAAVNVTERNRIL